MKDQFESKEVGSPICDEHRQKANSLKIQRVRHREIYKPVLEILWRSTRHERGSTQEGEIQRQQILLSLISSSVAEASQHGLLLEVQPWHALRVRTWWGKEAITLMPTP